MRVGFIVFEKNIEPRLMFLDQVRFEYEGFNLIIDNNKLKIGDHLYELSRLWIVIAARMKIGANTVAKVLGLADIDDLSGRILVNIDPGVGGQRFEFLGNGHFTILAGFSHREHRGHRDLEKGEPASSKSGFFQVHPHSSVLSVSSVANLGPLRSWRLCVKLLYVKTVVTNSPTEAAEFIKRGGVVAFPTETVYGLGANVLDAEAVSKIFEAKRRPADNPLIAHVANLEQIGELAPDVNKNARKFIDRFFPGPLTLVLPKSDSVPLIATAGLETIGVRMPRHELARRFLNACGVPVAAPSANLSGKPSPTTWQAVLEDLDGRIDCILQGEATEIGLESTVVDCTAEVPVLLRQGAIWLAELQAVVPETVVYEPVAIDAPRSPGLKHKHYSPRATVVLVSTGNDSARGSVSSSRSEKLRSLSLPVLTPSAAFIGISDVAETFAIKLICNTVNEYAHSLFEFFRECDRAAIQTIYCEKVPETGIGAALMDRLRRAAEG